MPAVAAYRGVDQATPSANLPLDAELAQSLGVGSTAAVQQDEGNPRLLVVRFSVPDPAAVVGHLAVEGVTPQADPAPFEAAEPGYVVARLSLSEVVQPSGLVTLRLRGSSAE